MAALSDMRGKVIPRKGRYLMISIDKGMFYLSCDVCGDIAEPAFETFDEAVDYKVDEGWKSQRRDSEWEDVCSDCAKS